MGQRHQSRRRRSYGRRQHELRERRARRNGFAVEDAALELEPGTEAEMDAPQALRELFGPVFRFSEGSS